MRQQSPSPSSSSEEDEEHNAALRSVAIDSSAVLQFAMPSVPTSGRKSRPSKSFRKKSATNLEDEDDDDDDDGTGGLKLYQTRVQDLLHRHLDKVFKQSEVEVAVESENVAESGDHVADDENYDPEIRLYSNTPPGVALKKSKPTPEVRLPPRYDSSDEDSAEKVSRFQAAAVEGSTITTQAEKARASAFARFLAGEEASQKALKAEAERVGQLRKERGEVWLPSVSKDILKEARAETERRKTMSSGAKIGVVADYRL